METTWTVAGHTLSGLLAEPEQPIGTVLALHGGGYSAGYWHNPVDVGASLLTLGPQLGFRVAAIDRPGYGASHGITGADVRVENQSKLMLELAASLKADGLPLFVIGHSMGAILAIRMGADAADGLVDGIDVSGVPFVFDGAPVDAESLRSVDYLPDLPVEFARGMFYGPDGTFEDGVLAADRTMARPTPAAEIIDALECPNATPGVAPLVRCPIQITRAEFENSSGGGRESLDRLGSLFTGSSRVVLQWQVDSGHNISLHHVAQAYHLRALAFFDEVRRHPTHVQSTNAVTPLPKG